MQTLTRLTYVRDQFRAKFILPLYKEQQEQKLEDRKQILSSGSDLYSFKGGKHLHAYRDVFTYG